MSMDKVARLERRACGRDPPGGGKKFGLLPVDVACGLWCMLVGGTLPIFYFCLRAGGILPALYAWRSEDFVLQTSATCGCASVFTN